MYSRSQTAVDGSPRHAAVVASKCSGRGYRDIDALRIRRIENDGVQAQSARARLPVRTGPVARNPESSCQFCPPSLVRNNAASSTPA